MQAVAGQCCWNARHRSWNGKVETVALHAESQPPEINSTISLLARLSKRVVGLGWDYYGWHYYKPWMGLLWMGLLQKPPTLIRTAAPFSQEFHTERA
jgi:hypothetical protein